MSSCVEGTAMGVEVVGNKRDRKTLLHQQWQQQHSTERQTAIIITITNYWCEPQEEMCTKIVKLIVLRFRHWLDYYLLVRFVYIWIPSSSTFTETSSCSFSDPSISFCFGRGCCYCNYFFVFLLWNFITFMFPLSLFFSFSLHSHTNANTRINL